MSARLKPELACPHHGAPRALLALRNITVIVDPQADHHPCIGKAARIALHAGAELELYACDTQGVDRREMLEALARPLRARALDVKVCADRAAALETGVGYHVLRTAPDLIVKDLPPSGTGRAISQADWMLARQLPAPLLLCSPEPWPQHLRFAVSIDPCHPAVRTPSLDDAMLVTSFMLADALGAETDVLHVLETPPHLPGEPVSNQRKLAQHAAARAVVHSFVAGANPQGMPVRTRFEDGPVAERIIEFVSAERPQVLTLGIAPRPRWAFAGAGGTAGQLLGALPCDLLVVKPPGFVSPLLVTE